MNTLDTGEEEQLLTAVKEAVSLVDDQGMTPDAALEKVARDRNFGPGRIKMIGHAYNTGQQLHQWDENKGILDKLASFTLCDPQKVVDRIYTGAAEKEKAASAVHEDYRLPPTWLERPMQKAASYTFPSFPKPEPLQPDPVSALRRSIGLIDRQKKANDQGRLDIFAAEQRLHRGIGGLVSYFHKYASTRLPFATVETAANTYLGDSIKPLLNIVYRGASLQEKRAGEKLSVSAPVPPDSEPMILLKACVKAAQDTSTARAQHAAGLAKLAAMEEELNRPFAAPVPPSPHLSGTGPSVRLSLGEKRSEVGGAVGLIGGTMLSRLIGDTPKTKSDLIEDAWMDLEDPAHQNELRKIRANAMLTSMMTDPDDPLAGHDPDKVLQHYNEISPVAPRTAENASTLRPLLRRRLHGHTEPFEAKELMDIEKGLAQTRLGTPNTAALMEAPDNMHG